MLFEFLCIYFCAHRDAVEFFLIVLEKWAEALCFAAPRLSANWDVFTSAPRAPDTSCVILERYPQH